MNSHLHLRRSLGLALSAVALASAPAPAMAVDRSVGLTAQEQQVLASRGVGPIASAVDSPESQTVAQSPTPSDDTPWLPIALATVVAMAIIAASAPRVRRLRIRRRAARVTT
jgi:hypothetical protein